MITPGVLWGRLGSWLLCSLDITGLFSPQAFAHSSWSYAHGDGRGMRSLVVYGDSSGERMGKDYLRHQLPGKGARSGP
jgi:hypothetical protein